MRTVFLTVFLAAGLMAAGPMAAGDARADVTGGWQAYLEGDAATALAELEPAAQAGDAAAEYYLGVLYDHGAGVDRDHRTAAEWYEKAARQDHLDAQFKLGMLYRDGAGSPGDPNAVRPDPAAAARWFTPAAQTGHVQASYELCILVDGARGAPRDLERALTLCRVAAQHGIPGAQYHTGLLMAERKADMETWTEAYAWFLLAQRANYPGAMQNLEAMARWLSESDIARAHAAAAAFRPLSGGVALAE